MCFTFTPTCTCLADALSRCFTVQQETIVDKKSIKIGGKRRSAYKVKRVRAVVIGRFLNIEMDVLIVMVDGCLSHHLGTTKENSLNRDRFVHKDGNASVLNLPYVSRTVYSHSPFFPTSQTSVQTPSSDCCSSAVVMLSHQHCTGIIVLGQEEQDHVSPSATRRAPQTSSKFILCTYEY